MNTQSAFNEDASIMSSTKLAVKITCDNITKRVRDAPESFEALKSTVKAQISKSSKNATFVRQGNFAITYTDDTGDVINVSDDEDLHAAYDVAENFMNRQLKLQIKQRDNHEEDIQIDSKQTQKIESQQPHIQNQIGNDPLKKSFKQEDEEITHIDSNVMKKAIEEALNNNKQDKEEESSDETEEESAAQAKGGKKKQAGKKDKGMNGLPRKCFKKLIKKELDKQCQGIFKDLMNCRELGEDADKD